MVTRKRRFLLDVAALFSAALLTAGAGNAAAPAPGTPPPPIDQPTVLAPTSFALVDLGTLGGVSWARAVNEAGEVVGFSETEAGARRPFLYANFCTSSGCNDAMVDITTFLPENDSLFAEGEAYAIDDNGSVVGYTGSGSPGGRRAFLWRGGDSVDTPITTQSFGRGIGPDNAIIGSETLLRQPPFDLEQAFLTDPGHRTTIVFDLGARFSRAHAINRLGQVVGESGTSDPVVPRRGFFWDPEIGLFPLAAVPGIYVHRAFDVNDHGEVVGQGCELESIFTDAECYFGGLIAFHALRWQTTAGSTASFVQDLGTLGGASASAEGINNDGWIVGTSRTSDGSLHAFLYVGDTMLDLNQFVLGGDVASASWELIRAEDVNDRGEIVGLAFRNGVERAFLLRPCDYALSPTAASFDETGGSGTVQVSAAPGCSWSLASSASWLRVSSAASGNGDGSVAYVVDPAAVDRSGSISLQGLAPGNAAHVEVSQTGATASPTPVLRTAPLGSDTSFRLF